MKKFFQKTMCNMVTQVKGMGARAKAGLLMAAVAVFSPVGSFAQSLANTGYEAGTSAMEEVATEIAKYVPYVVNLCYALAGVVAIVGAISVYYRMFQKCRLSLIYSGLCKFPLQFCSHVETARTFFLPSVPFTNRIS